MWDENEYYDDDWSEGWDDWHPGDYDSTNSGADLKETTMGQHIYTSNADVNSLPDGSVLEVVGKGELRVVSVPVPKFQEGDRVYTKHGPSTVVRLSSRFSELVPFDNDTEVLYVSDDADVVRKARKTDVSF